MLNITDAIIELVRAYGYSAEEINDGQCWDFAEDLQKLFPEGEVQDNRTLTGRDEGWDHAFFRLDGRYYDSETPNGVDDWMQLPCCQRCTA
jgi:hypothetical protein